MNIDPGTLNKELGYLILYLSISIPVLIIYLWLSRRARKEWMVLMGHVKPKVIYEWERRQYIRLNTVFPIEFQVMEGNNLGTLRQAFTKDVSRNGLRLEAKVLRNTKIENIVPDESKLKLFINMPYYSDAIIASGTVKWVQKTEKGNMDNYSIGVHYDDIKSEDASRILKYALWLYRSPVFIGGGIVLLILIITVLAVMISDLQKAKHRLQQKVEVTYQEKKVLVDRIRQAENEKEKLSNNLRNLMESERKLKEDLLLVREEGLADKEEIVRNKRSAKELEAELEEIKNEKAELRSRIDELEEYIIYQEEVKEEESAEEEEEEESSEE